MAVLIDPPAWPAHGRLWSHLASDTSLAELHAFAAATGVPRRSFEGDHYDVPQERYDDLVAAGAQAVPGRELLHRLVAGGLRVPKRRGERVLSSGPDERLLPVLGPHHVDVVASRLATPDPATVGGWLLAVDAAGRLLLTRSPERGWGLPGTGRRPGESPAGAAVRAVTRQTGLDVDAGELVPCGYQRTRLGGPPPAGWPFPAPWSIQAMFSAVLADVGALDGRAVWAAPPEARERVGSRRWWPLAQRLLGA